MGASQLAVALCLAIGITFSAPGLGSEGRSVASVPFDGTEHNEANPTWGSTFIQLRRLCSSVYADGVSELAGPTRPGARTISNTLMSQESSVVDPRGLSDMVWQFGQFLDHDVGLTPVQEAEEGEEVETAPIEVPSGDPFFDPEGAGTVTLGFTRSIFDESVGAGLPRQQENVLTAWLDGSGVYGSNRERADALRTFEGGLMKTSPGNLLPLNTLGLQNEDALDLPPETLFVAGDIRVNEQIGLFAMHALFVREHNTIAMAIHRANPCLSDEEIYQRARRIVAAEIQAITYNEFLPTLLGEGALSPYTGYDPTVDGSLLTEFSSAGFRLGHTMLSPRIALVDDDGNFVEGGTIGLREAFFVPETFASVGLGPVLNGLSAQPMQKVDLLVIDDVRNFLFGDPGMGGRDLPSINIQRGRDHGIPGFNIVRSSLGLDRYQTFEDLTGETELAAKMASIYDSIEDVDLWIGLLAEPLMDGASVGETLSSLLVLQFEKLRDGDRFFYLNDEDVEFILGEIGLTMGEFESEFSRLGNMIVRNTDLTSLQDNVFLASCPGPDPKCRAVNLCTAPLPNQRTFDGSENNIANPERGATDTQILRLTPPAYADGVSAFAGPSRPSPRIISNELMIQRDVEFDPRSLSDMVWQWGQFLDHDIGLSPPGDTEPAPIAVPKGDPQFDPDATGTVMLEFSRSIFDESVPDGEPRQQTNVLTTWIDASNVYGSDLERADALRTGVDGRMKVSLGNLLPFNEEALENEDPFGRPPESLFIAGDIRVNEQIGLVSFHTLFVREHNRLAALFKDAIPCLSDEEIFQRARRVVGAEMQAITFNEFVPAILGDNGLAPYAGYNPSVDGTLFTEFTTAAFRLGHTMLSSNLSLLANDGSDVAGGSIPLRDSFFNTEFILENGLDAILKGLSAQQMQRVDLLVIDDLRNFLFGEPGDGGRDLPSTNIQRGRDHGLADYNAVRQALGLARKESFGEITGESATAGTLEAIYSTVDNIDLWVGLLAEPLEDGSSVGEALGALLRLQFQNLRDGDRFFYSSDPVLVSILAEIGLTLEDFEASSRLSSIIMQNTFLTDLQENVFFASCQGSAQCDPSSSESSMRCRDKDTCIP